MYDKTIRLTKKTATQLIHQIMPRAVVIKDETAPEATIFRAVTNGLEIRCENDWFKRNKRIKLTITDGENTIVHYYSPTTLNRDFFEEKAEKDYFLSSLSSFAGAEGCSSRDGDAGLCACSRPASAAALCWAATSSAIT